MMLTTQQAADELGISRRRLVKLIQLGFIKAEKFGQVWQVDPQSVEERKQKEPQAGRPKKQSNVAANVAGLPQEENTTAS